MTTIAYRAGKLAYDTQMSCGTLIRRVHKAWKFKDGSLFAISGSVYDSLKIKRWAESGYKGKGPTIEETTSVECMHVRHDGVYLIDGDLVLLPVSGDFHAIGCGGGVALGAMAHGATALEAIQTAAEFDAGTSGPFHVLTFSRQPAKKRAK
jgi:ATP-dependent protease HslVU (ClpYQ) peptidase subunit